MFHKKRERLSIIHLSSIKSVRDVVDNLVCSIKSLTVISTIEFVFHKKLL